MANKISPRTVAGQVLLASEDVAEARRAMLQSTTDSVVVEEALDCAAISIAGAVVQLTALSRRDKRFDFGVIRDSLLEFLPLVVIASPGLTPERLQVVRRQLDLLAQQIVSVASGHGAVR